jgi:hypothetical protein
MYLPYYIINYYRLSLDIQITYPAGFQDPAQETTLWRETPLPFCTDKPEQYSPDISVMGIARIRKNPAGILLAGPYPAGIPVFRHH